MSANPINNELAFGDAALRHWALLGEELRQDIQQFNERGGSVEFARQASNEYRVTNPASGLEVHGCRTCARIIKTNHFQRASVASAFFVDYHYTIIRLLARTYARETNH